MSPKIDCRNEEATAARRVYITFGAAIFVVAHFLGGIETYFADNLYNQGVVARSAQFDGGTLVTAYKHWFFDGRPAVRPEDWHRSATLLAYAAIVRHWPGNSAEIVRIAHAAMFTLWGLMIMALIHGLALRQPRTHALPEDSIVRLAGVVFLGALAALPFISRVAMNTYLDDLPAAVAALGACGLLLVPMGGPLRIAGAGALAGAAFWMKDLYLVWVLCAPVVAWTLIPGVTANGALSRRRRVWRTVLFSAVMLTIVSGKIAWNISELGIALPDQARIALNARLMNDIEDPENQFFHHLSELDPPTSYSAALFANNPAAVLVKHTLATFEALRGSGLIVLFLVIAAGAVLARGLSSLARRILMVSAIVTATFGVFFSAGLGEAGQLRYWLVPFSGALALATALAWQGLCTVKAEFCPSACLRLRACFWLAMAVFTLPQGLATLLHDYSKEPPLTDEFMENAAQWAKPGETLLVQLHRGTYFWARYPHLAFTGISAGATMAADCNVLHAVTREAKARIAAVAFPPMIEKLKACDFRVLQTTDRAALLIPPETPAYLIHASE